MKKVDKSSAVTALTTTAFPVVKQQLATSKKQYLKKIWLFSLLEHAGAWYIKHRLLASTASQQNLTTFLQILWSDTSQYTKVEQIMHKYINTVYFIYVAIF